MRVGSRGALRRRQAVRVASEAALRGHVHVVEALEGRVMLSVVKFAAEVSTPLGSSAQAVLATDVNGDGKMDLLTADYNAYSTGAVSVLLGNGNGTFKAGPTYPTGTGTDSMVMGDFNGDHKTDLAVSNSDGTLDLFLGNGNGTFAGPNTISLGGAPERLAVADVNLDQKQDLFVTSLGSTAITELLGNGNGTFLKSQVTLATGLVPLAITAMDLTNDNRPDLVVAIGSKSAVGVMVNVGNSQFAPAVTYDAGINPNEVALGDLNGDGFTDLVIPNNSAGANFVSVLQGNGNGTFRPRQTFFTGDTAPTSVAVTDLNGDGKLDLAVADYNFKEVAILLNDGGGSFLAPQKFGTSSNPSHVIGADLDGDGKPDLAFAQSYAGSVGTMLNTSQPFVVSISRKQPTAATTSVQVVNFTVTFNGPVTGVDPTDFAAQGIGVSSGAITVTPVNASVYTVTVSGVSGNGRLGLNLVNNGSIHDLTGQSLQTTPLSFTAQQTVAFASAPSAMVLKDVNGDGKPDMVLNENPGVNVLLGNGNGTFQAPKTFSVGNFDYGLAVADVNGDGKMDLVVPNITGSYAGTISVLLGNGNGTFQARLTSSAGTNNAPYAVAVADVNGDGKPDLMVNDSYLDRAYASYGKYTYYQAARFTVMLGNGDGTFKPPGAALIGGPGINFKSAPVLADLSGDGKADLAVETTTYNITTHVSTAFADVLLGNGNGTFQTPHAYTFGTSGIAQQPVTADVNGDGKPDLIAPVGGRVSVLLGNGNGTFRAAVVSEYTGSAPGVVIVDANGDGKPDVLAPGAYGFAVSLGAGDGTFQPGPAFLTRGKVYTLAAADLNGDGKPDVLAGYAVPRGAYFPSGGIAVLLGSTQGVASGESYAIVLPVDSINGSTGPDTVTLTRDADGVDIDMTGPFNLSTAFPINDSKGLTFTGNGGNDVLVLNYSNGNPLPNILHLTGGSFTINGLSGAAPFATTLLDVATSTVYVNYASVADPVGAVQAALKAGYNGGTWATSGAGVITSLAAASGPPGVFGVGYADSVDGAVSGQPANTVELRYTVMGDVNLDRAVNSTDAVLLARNYQIAGRSNWDQGNFNYDTTIDLSDAQILQKNYNATASGSVTPGVDPSGGSGLVATPIVQGTTTGSGSSTDGVDPAGTTTIVKRKKHHHRDDHHR